MRIEHEKVRAYLCLAESKLTDLLQSSCRLTHAWAPGTPLEPERRFR